MGRRPCCSKEGQNKGAWSVSEDKILTEYIKLHGEGKWRDLPTRAGLKRCGKSCRLRWMNYLRPGIKRGNISDDEVELIIKLHKLLGNRWSLIARRLPGRTDNEIKNYWNTNLSKKAEPRQTLHNSKRRDVNVLDSSEVAATADKQSHQVIRTKAVRCTKVYLQTLQDLDDYAKPNNENIAPPSNQTPSSSLFPPHAGSIDLFMDFNMEELMSSFADDGFYSLCNNNEDKDDGNVIGSYAGEDSLWFSETIQEEWRENNGTDHDDFACI
uniref:Transcription factor TT2-like n=1 Tax=Ananas comosus var. bracteatus TaxID=296719 RepID=A0A6V7P676_ANACO|nr:unnamed protein product [Ananas comosus var. bracteatus]